MADPVLQMTVSAFHAAVLVRDAAVVAGRRHRVMLAKSLVAPGQVFLGFGRQVEKGGRERVGPVFEGRGPQAPQRILQAGGESGEALPAEDDLAMFPAGIDESEVIQPMVEAPAGDRHAESAAVGEVRHPLASWRMVLAEDHFLLGAVDGFPLAHAPLEGAARRRQILVGEAAAKFFQDGHRPQARRFLQHRNDIAFPDIREGIGFAAAMAALGLLLRGKTRVLLKSGGGAGAEARHRCRRHLTVSFVQSHIQSRLLIRDRSAGHPGPLPGG